MKTLADSRTGNSCLPDEWPDGAFEDTDPDSLFDIPDLSDDGDDE